MVAFLKEKRTHNQRRIGVVSRVEGNTKQREKVNHFPMLDVTNLFYS
jgi:hypothetical protein